MSFKKWILSQVNKQLALSLAEECDIDPLVALIAVSRGYQEPYEIEQFLSEEPIMRDPFDLQDMDKAVVRIMKALEAKEKIAIYGDYDCDGVTATALLYDYLKSVDADVIFAIPSREIDGYGMSVRQIELLHQKSVDLIITVDNGINSIVEVAAAKEMGMDVIITDHHLLLGNLPEAIAIVDPYLQTDVQVFKGIAGVGIAFKLVCALSGLMPEEMLDRYADLVAIGTVADIMPLRDENRTIVREGLKLLNNGARVGLSALAEVSALTNKKITAGNISFMLAPRINAAGRMGNAQEAVNLLLENDYESALLKAKEIDSQNAERQSIEQQIVHEAYITIEQNGYNYDKVIVVAGIAWHSGIIGIVASRIVEKYGKPCIILSIDGEMAVGSGRSISGFSLFDCICSVKHLTEKFGGHELAAGVSLKVSNIDEFRRAINKYASNMEMPFLTIKLDCKLNPVAIDVNLVKALDALAPFGAGNSTPIFGLYSMKLEKIVAIGGGKHLKLQLSRNGSSVSTLMFGVSEEQFAFEIGDTVDLAVTLDVNEYRGSENVSIIVKAIRKSCNDQEKLAQQIRMYDSFYRGELVSEDAAQIKPDRTEIGILYRYIVKSMGKVTPEKAKTALCMDLPVGKFKIATDVLCELGIIKQSVENGVTYLLLSSSAGKVNLSDSKIIKRLNVIQEGAKDD